MKLVRSNGAFRFNICYRYFGIRRVSLYSTTATVTAPKKSRDTLYRRISPIGDPRVSIVPVLDQWIEEGRDVNKDGLHSIIKELRSFRRFKHALEVSLWMSDKRHFQLSSRDIAVRLDLISKVHGIAQAEIYFNNNIEQAKLMETYSVLLNCYVEEKSVEKAEDIMQKMRNLGLARTPLCYNVMLNLYHQTRKYEKLDALMREMEEKGIQCDKFTFSIRLTAYASMSDTEGMDRILQRMESDPGVVLDWDTYAVAASAYMKAGIVDKALAMLKKSEGLIVTSKRKNDAFNFLLTQYATTGKKDEVLRLWEVYKKTEKIYNKGYISMITSLLKFDDIDGAEKIFDEWESSELSYDFRVPNFLIGAYSRKGLMEKAEAFINRAEAKGGKPLARTWYYLATGYVDTNQIPKALEVMKVAISMCQSGWKPSKATLVACLEYLKGKGDVEEALEFIRSLQAKGIVSTEIHDRLLNYIKNGKSNSNISSLGEGDSVVGDGETPNILVPEQVGDLFEDEDIHGISKLK
uniref:Pentatricopeptide repeat-containing protein n=1 Tax=Davidia involucrata TaxID=16924 RepID=A0A5B7CCI5_DAVIN